MVNINCKRGQTHWGRFMSICIEKVSATSAAFASYHSFNNRTPVAVNQYAKIKAFRFVDTMFDKFRLGALNSICTRPSLLPPVFQQHHLPTMDLNHHLIEALTTVVQRLQELAAHMQTFLQSIQAAAVPTGPVAADEAADAANAQAMEALHQLIAEGGLPEIPEPN